LKSGVLEADCQISPGDAERIALANSLLEEHTITHLSQLQAGEKR
jgi:hypothetical protein